MKQQEQVYVCAQCIHYAKHYIKSDEGYITTALGHCIYPRIKSRRSYTKACTRFEKRQNPL